MLATLSLAASHYLVDWRDGGLTLFTNMTRNHALCAVLCSVSFVLHVPAIGLKDRSIQVPPLHLRSPSESRGVWGKRVRARACMNWSCALVHQAVHMVETVGSSAPALMRL